MRALERNTACNESEMTEHELRRYLLHKVPKADVVEKLVIKGRLHKDLNASHSELLSRVHRLERDLEFKNVKTVALKAVVDAFNQLMRTSI